MKSFSFYDVLTPDKLSRDFNPYVQPQGIDFRNYGFAKEVILDYGQKISTVYYQSYDFANKVYSNPVVKCDRVVDYDFNNSPIKLTKSIFWRLSDGTWKAGLSWEEPIIDPLAFWQKRRSRIVNQLKKLAFDFSTEEFPLEEYLVRFFEQNQVLINSYIDAGSGLLQKAVKHSSEKWIDVVIEATGNSSREVLLDYLSKGVFEVTSIPDINSEILEENKLLTSGDSEINNFTVNLTDIEVILPENPQTGLKYTLINNEESAENLLVNQIILEPGDTYSIEFDGDNWVVL